jgi:hypothetical protein
MEFDCMDAEVQTSRGLGVGPAECDQLENLELTRGERHHACALSGIGSLV